MSEFIYPSKEWANEWCRRLNESKEYNDAGKGWVSPILFVVTDLPPQVSESLGLKGTSSLAMKLYLNNGQCQGVEFFTDLSKADAPYILEATYENWKGVITGKLQVVSALLSGTIKLKKGSLFDLARYTTASVIMAKISTEINTKFLS
ncbi:SCP2 sterol-binding domain-containing protein [Saccharolobus caldissimus]|uniref:Fis family transcriptional regulator n=1 Tax=Saccharolobus caldissimus TaxID=1702097 RepID=A0AAQ4CSH2_9CREN|nr:Fis family transcriptional regulator [Saccharolobus caldissimus]BDB98753.1 Fis family transcriptional regulator [Saccharolobus caldissimus]